MKIKIEIKNRYTGKVLFELSTENNTKRKTILQAIRQNADLSYADLSYADLSSADLSSADLSSADLSYADLRSADLSSANLSSANLSSANLRSADLRSANLRSANLRSADLRSANLRSANLRSADLRSEDINRIKHYFQIIPEEGSFIGWKKLSDGVLAKIEIPAKAKRTCNLKNRKCRASCVKTIELIDREGNSIKEGLGDRDNTTVYKVGRITKPDSYDDDMREDCTNGIHFFVTRQEAQSW